MDVRLPDGTIITNVPEGTTQSELMRRVGLMPTPPAAPVKDAGFSLGDIAKSFGMGATGSTKALTDVAGAGNVVSSKLEGATESLQRSLTPERQAEMERQAARMKAAEESGSILQEIKAGALNVAEAPLQSAAQAIGSFVPYLPAMFAAPVAAAMRLTAGSQAAIRAVAQQAPKVIGTAQGAGAVKGSIYDGVLRAEVEAGVDPEVAKQKADAAQSYFGGNFDQIALGGGLGFVAGSSGVERFLTPAGRVGAAQNMGRRVGEAVIKETLPEAAQGGQERVAQNIALQREGYDVDTFAGAAGAATQEALTGALGAAPIAALSKPDPTVAAKKEQDKFEQEEAEFRKGFGEATPVKEPELPTEFPGGYTATRRELSRQDVPESYGIFPEGADKPLTTVKTQEEAQAKLQTLTEIRAEEQARLVAESDKIDKEILAERRKLEVLEATGQTDTDQYVQSKAALLQREEEAAQQVAELNDRIVSYSTPLTLAPVGSRTDVQSDYVVKRGDQEIGAFPTLQDVGLKLRELEPETFKQAEQQARVKTDDRVQQLKQTLTPMLAKFGLQDVGLNIVEKIENDAGGKYTSLDKLIDISLRGDTPIQTMRHESLHALKDLQFFTPQQWKALTDRANKQWIKEYLQDKQSVIEVDGKPQTMSRLDAYRKLGYTQEEIVEEAIADAFGAYDRGATPPPGMIAALFKKLKDFFANFGQALRGAGFESADDVFQRVERGELKSRKPKAEAKAEPRAEPKEPVKAKEPTEKEPVKAEAPEAEEAEPPVERKEAKSSLKAKADKYEEENGIRPYVSEGELDLPIKAPKYSLQKFNPDKHLSFDPTLGVPINRDGTVTVYYHTTKAQALAIGKSKVIPAEGRNRVYLTNESGGDSVLRNRGSFDQELDGSTVLVYVTPDMLQVDAEYPNGRRDFFIPLEEGDFFNKKMKMQSIQKGRDEAITGEFSYSDHEAKMTKAVEAYKDAPAAERRAMLAQARKTLKSEHNVGSLLSENGKLEKTRVGEYGLEYEGNSVASQGLGLAAAQKITEKVSTCPRSAICEGLCLGETSGGNFLFGGTATEDVADIKKSAFRAGPRMMQYLKTEALIINPEAFAILLQAEIDSLKKWSASPTQVKIDPETKKRLNVEKEIYQPAVRLNVTSDFKPEMFRAIIEGNPDVQFYDYTKLGNEPLSDNHHLTYSSTGFGQIVNGEKVFFKTKTGQYDHNWATMRKRLNNGQNVAMAFSSKSALPKSLLDEETRTEYRIWDGDDYDARFLDPKQPDGKGMIIGLRNKAGNLSEKNATERTGGFFVQYNPKTDGDTVFVPDQAQFKDGGRKVVPITKEKFSLRAPVSPAFKQWFGDSKIVDADGKPKVMYHGLAKDTTDFTRKTERGAPIFLTDDPKFADRFATDSYLQVADHPEKYLTKAQLGEGEKRAISFIRKDYGKDTLGKEMIASIRDGSPTAEAREYLQKEYVTMLPTGPHVMPLYVRAENPFDYENPKHIRKVLDELGESAYDPAEIRSGGWESIEGADFQEAIQFAGFDSFYVKEHGRKNLAVYQPNQVKSATGNAGTFSRESDDVRYSLKNVAFPSAEEAKKAVAKTSVPKTDEFKLFIAGNQWVDEDGDQKVFYHGTASEFFEFTPAGKASAIYLADTPEEAEIFGKIAEDRLREQVYRALTKDEKVDFFQGIVDAKVDGGSMTEKEGADFMRQVKRKAPEFGSFGDLERETRAALIDLSPTRSAIMPLYARADTPFDFRNPDHVAQIAQAVRRPDAKLSEEFKQEAREMGAPTEYPDQWYRGLPGLLKQGYLTTIEQEPVQTAIRRLGFDGYVARRNRNSPVVYAVYKPEQVKSATGNLGEFSREAKDIRYSLRGFSKEDLPQKQRDYTLPENTLLYHGAYKDRADRIDEMGSVLLSRPPMRVSGGTIDEGGLIFFGDKDTAQQFAENRADPMAVEAARKAGVERLSGKVFETATDRPYKLINRRYKMNAKEAKALTEALGLPDYKSLDAGDSLEIATGRALDYGRSTIDRYEVTRRTGQGKETISAPWPVIFRTLGVDGFYDSLGVALTANNGIKLIGKDGKLEKFSLPTIPQNLQDRINETTSRRERKTVIQSIVDAIRPTSAADFRAKYLNRYNQMSVYDKKLAEKMGGAALLADQSAESAALMSDLGAGVAASAMGFEDRNGGIPVLRNGITTIDKSVKGLIASLAPLAQYGDPIVYQQYQYWAMVKRGQRLNKEGKLTGVDSADVAFAKILEQKYPEFASVQKDLIAFNDGLVKYMVDTGVLSKERGQMYTKYADYIPFYRQMDGDQTLGPNLFQSLSGVKPPKKLKGADAAEAPLADFLETMVRNTQSSIQAGIKNYAAQRAINVAVQLKEPGIGAERLNTKENGPNIINVLEKGNLVSYRTPDTLLVNAMMSLNQSELPFIGFLSAPADLLRNLVTKEPGFMMANMMRDSLSAWVTSGQSMTPIAGTVINFGKGLARKSPGFEAMLDAGIIGGYEFNENIEKSGFKLEDDLAKKAGKKDPILLRPFTSVWDALGKGTTASDAATRALIYERVLADTGNEAEALYRSLEVMNFHRKGSSPLIRVLTAAVPFFNARLQGLDLFYRASTGNMNNKDAASIQRQFFLRGMTMMALSGLYWMLVSDDEEYKKQEQETKDNNWIIPAIGVKIPIPFEVGVLFKVIPERIMAYSFGNDTGEDLKKSMIRAAVSTFAFNPIPQTVKPILEAVVDYNMFTMRPILGQGMKDVEPEFQVGPSTSNFAKLLAQNLGLSPIKVDHIIKGYTGTIGMYAIDTIDIVLDQFGDSPKPTKRFEQLPVIKRFASDPEARGFVTQYYELKDSVDTTVRTMNLLEKTSQPEEYTEYLIKNQGTLAFKDYVRDTEKTMTYLREMKVAIRASTMTGDEKRDSLLEISKMESAITSNIQEIKKAIAQAQ
jgi:hypothetical protein